VQPRFIRRCSCTGGMPYRRDAPRLSYCHRTPPIPRHASKGSTHHVCPAFQGLIVWSSGSYDLWSPQISHKREQSAMRKQCQKVRKIESQENQHVRVTSSVKARYAELLWDFL
jgi:hypothetical protein